MKRTILIIIVVLSFFGFNYAQGIYLSTRDSIAYDGFEHDDLIGVGKDLSGTYTYHKASWYALTKAFQEYVKNKDNAWAVLQTFIKGASFSNASNGAVTFGDSVNINAILTLQNFFFPVNNEQGIIGFNARRFLMVASKYMYADHYYILDPIGVADSTNAAKISYNNGNVSFDKPMHLTKDFSYDSAAVQKNNRLGIYTYPINMTDSVLTLQDSCAIIYFNLPGNVSNMERIVFAGDDYGPGMIIKFYNDAAVDLITFKDYDAGDADHNLQLGGDITLGQYDYLELTYINAAGNYYWIKSGYEDN